MSPKAAYHVCWHHEGRLLRPAALLPTFPVFGEGLNYLSEASRYSKLTCYPILGL